MMRVPDYTCTYSNHEELWKGPSWLVKAKLGDGSQHVWACGWYGRQIPFEYPEVQIDEATAHIGSTFELSSVVKNIERFEIEISLDDQTDCTHFLSDFVGWDSASKMIKSMTTPGTRVSANRPNKVFESLEQFDLLTVNMPARSGDYKEQLRSISRWCRIFVLDKGTITLYEPLREKWLSQLRWPHNAIWLNRGSRWYLENTEENELGSIDSAISKPIKYMEYNLDNWKVEEALWRIGTYTTRTQEELEKDGEGQTTLALFVKDTVMSMRALECKTIPHLHRLGLTESEETVRESLGNMREAVKEARVSLREDMEIRSEAARYVQSKTSEELNQLIELLSTIFLAPTIIVSFFSMSFLLPSGGIPQMVAGMVLVFALCILSGLGVWHMIRRKRR